MMPRRIQLRRQKGYRKPSGSVNVARPTPWGNPFKVNARSDNATAVAMYHLWLSGGIPQHNLPMNVNVRRDWILSHLAELRGKDLACWCPLDKPCHADVLLELANKPEAANE